MIKMEDLRKQNVKQLLGQLAKTQADLAVFNLDVRTKEVSNIRRGRLLRRDMARIKTVIREKEIGDE